MSLWLLLLSFVLGLVLTWFALVATVQREVVVDEDGVGVDPLTPKL